MSNNIKQDELVPKVQILNNDRLTASVSQLGLIIPRVLSNTMAQLQHTSCNPYNS